MRVKINCLNRYAIYADGEVKGNESLQLADWLTDANIIPAINGVFFNIIEGGVGNTAHLPDIDLDFFVMTMRTQKGDVLNIRINQTAFGFVWNNAYNGYVYSRTYTNNAGWSDWRLLSNTN